MSINIASNPLVTLSTGEYKYSEIKITSGELIIDGNVKLYVTGGFSIGAGGKVTVKGNAEIYIDGVLKAGGYGIVNTNQSPKDVTICSRYAGDGEGITLSGSSDFYGTVYAPDANVKVIGNSDVYGSLVGEQLMISGTGDLHYDEALRTLGETTVSNYAVQNWKEQVHPYIIVP